MNLKRTHYLFAGFAFLVAFLTYFLTMQPTIPFWDCGEFAAAAWGLQIPHPPGSPLWTIVGRIAMILPTMSDPVARYNLFSVLASAATVTILYLTLVRLIKLWRGEPKSTADIFTHFGGALVGALSYCFTDSFWFNALECEVYAFGTLFIAMIPWLMIIWYDHADEEHSEKYILLVAYVIGLSMGVHQLALLTIFPCFMLIYYRRRREVTILSWLGMVAASVVAFLIAFQVVLSKIVEWLGSSGGGKVIAYALLAGSIYGIWYSQKNRKPLLNLSLWAAVLLFVGYSTYTMMVVRANEDPPMNENAPKTLAKLTSFINRDQYGYRPPFPRRVGDETGQKAGPTWTNYTSDWDFFWSYQTDHMYQRYLYWNFIGRENDKQDAGTDWSKTFGIPFLLGLFGLYWHFKRDPKRALTLLATFIMLGWMTAWYQNQQNPQPRERDYFYVGAFYVYAMWIGIGATGIMEMLRAKKKTVSKNDEEQTATPIITGEGNTMLIGATLLAALILVPLNQCVGLAGLAMGKNFDETSKWAEYSRAGNYIPFDYGYNIMQSCEKDAILFTYGDNDTFPLWCLQDVYGIRRDIRIVQLSLSNIGWFIDQMKNHSPWGAKKIILTGFSDESLQQPPESPLAPQVVQDVPKEVSFPLSAEAVRQITEDPNRGATQMRWMWKGTYGGGEGKQYIYTVSDQLIVDILKNNMNTRPIYFSTSVPDNYRAGLDAYLVAEGLSLRVTPDVHEIDRNDAGGAIFEDRLKTYLYDSPKVPAQDARKGMLLRTYNDPNAHHSYLDAEYSQSYYLAYMKLAGFEAKKGNKAETLRALDTMDYRLNPDVVKSEYVPYDMIAELYDQAGNPVKAKRYAAFALKALTELEKKSTGAEVDPNKQLGYTYMHANIDMIIGNYDEAAKFYRDIQKATNQPIYGIKALEAEARKLEASGNKAAAAAKYDEIIKTFGIPEEQLPAEYHIYVEKRNALR